MNVFREALAGSVHRWLILWLLIGPIGCGTQDQAPSSGTVRLRGASSYTPYDAFSMLWARQDSLHEMVWVSSGGEAGRVLVGAPGPNRPDWALMTQGVVAGMAARGEDVAIIASVYVADDAILPVFRRGLGTIVGTTSAYIPRSSIEFAFDRLLEREGVSRSEVRTPEIESVGFATIANLLTKGSEESDHLDWAILVDPFISNIMAENPDDFLLGEPGLYNMHYSVVVRRADLAARRRLFIGLIEDLNALDAELRGMDSARFFEEVWGREKDGVPERLPRLITYRFEPSGLQLRVEELQGQLAEELNYLVGKYPDELRLPDDISSLVDPSLLSEVAPTKVKWSP